MTSAQAHDAFEHMYRTHRAAILSYLVRRTHDTASAADLLADVFLVAWRRHETLPPEDEQRLWLFGIARNMLLNHHRKMQKETRLGAKLADALAATRLEGHSTAPDERVLSALHSLPPRDRELLTLMIWDGLTTNEIAETVGLKPAAVRVATHRARQRLREALAAMGVAAAALHRADC